MPIITMGGYSGRENRGCEAIARSTSGLFHQRTVNVAMAFRNQVEADENKKAEYIDKCLLYKPSKNKFCLFLTKVWNKLFRNIYPYEKNKQKELLDFAKDNVVVNIGGDTFCYGFSFENDALVHFCRKKKVPVVLWGASIDNDAITNPRIKKVLKNYDRIYVRENCTFELLLKNGFRKEQLFLTADPAFTLKAEPVNISEVNDNWWKNGVVGINISPISMHENSDNMLAVEGCISVIEDVLKNTVKNVLLVPHVYKADYKVCDYEPLNLIKERFANEDRVQILKSDYSCNQLKYIISKLDIFIAARTHASIAAYSSLVPTLVIGYSIKSKGIAIDLFGTEKNYVLPIQELKSPDEILDAYKWIEANSVEIKEKLKIKIPEVQDQALSAVDDLIEKFI